MRRHTQCNSWKRRRAPRYTKKTYARPFSFQIEGRLDRIRRARTGRCDRRVGDVAWIRGANARPARDDSVAARRARPARAGRNRHGQDGGVRAADAAPHLQPRGRRSPAHQRARSRPDARAGHAGRRSGAQVRARRPAERAASLRRRADASAGTRTRAWGEHRRGNSRPRARPHPARHAEAGSARRADPRRSRRDARHGLRRGSGRDPRGDAHRAADGALLRDDAGADPVDCGTAL